MSQEQPSFMQSMQESKAHGMAFLRSTIGRHPGATAIILAVLVLVIVILSFVLAHYRAKCRDGKSGFHIYPHGNLDTGSNNPLWQFGSMDAGNWGPVHREATAWNVAAYEPGWRAGRYRRATGYNTSHASCAKEGMAAGGPAHGSPCGPGETPVTYRNPDGTTMTYCRSSDVLPGPPTVCGVGWDPAASAEAQALATVGSLQHDSYGERRLQRAVDGAFDANAGLSDRDLEALMHQGGTP
jgi:hypothetical protein